MTANPLAIDLFMSSIDASCKGVSTLFGLCVEWLVPALHDDGVDDDEGERSDVDGVEGVDGIVGYLLAQEHREQKEVGGDSVDVRLILFQHN